MITREKVHISLIHVLSHELLCAKKSEGSYFFLTKTKNIMNKFSFWLWNINGILIFGVLATLIYNRPNWLSEKQEDEMNNPYAYEVVSWGSIIIDKTKIDEGKHKNYAPMLMATGTLENSGYKLTSIVNMDLSLLYGNTNQYFMTTGLSNLLFADSTGRYLGKLLDKIGYIHLVDLNVNSLYDNVTAQLIKPAKACILYKISFEDSNKDGFLSEMDMSELYISDIDGKNLKKISPQNTFCLTYEFADDKHRNLRISYFDKSIFEETGVREQKFVEYDVLNQTYKPVVELNKAMKLIYESNK